MNCLNRSRSPSARFSTILAELVYAFHTGHKLREVLKLRPLVVCSAYWDTYQHRFVNLCRHNILPNRGPTRRSFDLVMPLRFIHYPDQKPANLLATTTPVIRPFS